MTIEPIKPLDQYPIEMMTDALWRWTASLGESFGVQVLTELVAFTNEAEPGAMLTIRRTRDGFTAQTTGRIVGGQPQPLTPQAIRDLLDLLEKDEGVVRNL
jgi:hypothetical protein